MHYLHGRLSGEAHNNQLSKPESATKEPEPMVEHEHRRAGPSTNIQGAAPSSQPEDLCTTPIHSHKIKSKTDQI